MENIKNYKIIIEEDELNNIIENLSVDIYNYYTNKHGKDVNVSFVYIMDGAYYFANKIFQLLHTKMNCGYYFVKVDTYNKKLYYGGDICISDVSHISDKKNILIFDDIYETGRTMHFLIEKINKYNNLLDIKTCFMLERNSPKSYNIYPNFVGKKIEEQGFLVGGGLDFKGSHRDLPYIVEIEEA